MYDVKYEIGELRWRTRWSSVFDRPWLSDSLDSGVGSQVLPRFQDGSIMRRDTAGAERPPAASQEFPNGPTNDHGLALPSL